MGKKGVWMLVLAAVVLAAGLAVTQKVRSRRHVVAYRTDTLQRGDIKVTVSASGTLDAVTTVQVGSQVSGTIAHLYADFNDRVKKGQLLAELDPTFLRAQVAQNQADLSGSEVQLHKALRDSARVFPLG
jgi:HlyD family secretion protein